MVDDGVGVLVQGQHSFFVFDPQGQFTRQRELVLNLQQYAREYRRPVRTLSVAEDIRLPQEAPLLLDLLEETRFFSQLTIKSRNENREAAKAEFQRLLRANRDWSDREPDDILRTLLQELVSDDGALVRIYASTGPRQRFVTAVQSILADSDSFEELLFYFRPVHGLFSRLSPSGTPRTELRQLLREVLDPRVFPKPYVVVDLSSRTGTTWLDDEETKARLIRKIASELRRSAESQWQETGRILNCSVVFDEAYRFASSQPQGEETSRLSNKLVEYVRETRKTGLGWTFITQQITSLHPAIYAQLTFKAFGYGMTSGGDLNRLRDEVGNTSALDLYQSFANPRALSESIYPFMVSGPISPLSFTAAPVFLQVYTSEDEFRQANRAHLPHRASDPR